MFVVRTTAVAVLSAACACLLHTQTAAADPLTLSFELTGNSPTRTGHGAGTSFSSVPVSDAYGNTLSASKPIPGTGGFTFYDDYLITIPTGQIDTLASSINEGSLSIDDLQARLYSVQGNPTSTLPVLGTPKGGVIDGWSQMLNPAPGLNIAESVIPTTQLQAGTYVLEIRGITGGDGGSYSGVLNIVPLPGALPLLLSALGLLGWTLRGSSGTSPLWRYQS